MTDSQSVILFVQFQDLQFHGADSRPPSAEAFDHILALLRDITPVVEPLPPDAALLDVRGSLRYHDRNAVQLAELIRVRSLIQYGLDCTVGIAANPLLARLAAQTTPSSACADRTDPTDPTACADHPVLGAIRVLGDARAVAAFLAPLPVVALPGVSRATARTLGGYGLHTVGLVVAAPQATLQRILGAGPGRQLHQRAQGIDPTPVATGVPTRSLAAEHSFDQDELDPIEQRRALLALTQHLGARLRAGGQATGTLTLTVRYADRSATARSRTLSEATAHTPALTATTYRLHQALGLQRARVRALTLRAEAIRPAVLATRQLRLDPDDDRAHRLEAVIDRSTTRYGTVVLTRAALCRMA